jgi:NitT/TauT family transport system permease protein
MLSNWLRVQQPLSQRAKIVLGCLSFLLPIALWCLVSYVPAIWHPEILITDVGASSYLQPGMQMQRADFESEVADARAAAAAAVAPG